jgi:hypothetical protein
MVLRNVTKTDNPLIVILLELALTGLCQERSGYLLYRNVIGAACVLNSA